MTKGAGRNDEGVGPATLYEATFWKVGSNDAAVKTVLTSPSLPSVYRPAPNLRWSFRACRGISAPLAQALTLI